jgi:hypothetical protein
LVLAFFLDQMMQLSIFPKHWYFRDSLTIVLFSTLPAGALLIGFSLPHVAFRERLQKAIGFQVHTANQQVNLPPTNLEPLPVQPLHHVEPANPPLDVTKREVGDSAP